MENLTTIKDYETTNQVEIDSDFIASSPVYSQPVLSLTTKNFSNRIVVTEILQINKIQAEIKEEMSPISAWVQIENLGNDLKLIYPVMVKVRLCESNIFIAECHTFDIFASGNNYEQALDNIKSTMAEDYKSFLEDYPDGLTETAKDLLRLYCAFLGKDLPSKR